MSGCTQCKQRPPSGTIDGWCLVCENDHLRAQVASLTKERDALRKERDQSWANHEDVVRKKRSSDRAKDAVIAEARAVREQYHCVGCASEPVVEMHTCDKPCWFAECPTSPKCKHRRKEQPKPAAECEQCGGRGYTQFTSGGGSGRYVGTPTTWPCIECGGTGKKRGEEGR